MSVSKWGHAILHNRIVEATIIFSVSAAFVILRVADTILHTQLRCETVRLMHSWSRDRLSVIRKAQIRYLFRREYGLTHVKARLAGGSYWMSIPCIISGIDRKTKVEKRYMGKIINDRSAIKHKYMTRFRNLGVVAKGADFVFNDHAGARDMVEYERDSLIRLRERNVDTPEVYGLHKLNFEDYILVMEYIDGEPLSEVRIDGQIAGEVFRTLKVMHDNGLFHGDIKLDNFLCSGGRVVVVDCLRVDENDIRTAQDFDLICAVCALAQKVPVDVVLTQARKTHTGEELKRSAQLIGIALNKVDLNLPGSTIKEIIDGLNE